MPITEPERPLAFLGTSTSLPQRFSASAGLEVITIVRDDESELAIRAMTMRPKYRPLLGGE